MSVVIYLLHDNVGDIHSISSKRVDLISTLKKKLHLIFKSSLFQWIKKTGMFASTYTNDPNYLHWIWNCSTCVIRLTIVNRGFQAVLLICPQCFQTRWSVLSVKYYSGICRSFGRVFLSIFYLSVKKLKQNISCKEGISCWFIG